LRSKVVAAFLSAALSSGRRVRDLGAVVSAAARREGRRVARRRMGEIIVAGWDGDDVWELGW